MARRGTLNYNDFVPPRLRYHDTGKFGRMPGSLPPFASDNPSIREPLLKLGGPGGPMGRPIRRQRQPCS